MYVFRVSCVSATEPVTVEELKSHLRVETTHDDTYLGLCITAARQTAKNLLRRSLVNTEWVLTIDSFQDKIELPMAAPLSTIATDVAIRYTNSSGAEATVNSSCYYVDRRAEPAFIREATDSEWPDNIGDAEGAVSITYRAGYSSVTPPATVAPVAIQHWIKQRAAQMYEFREPIITGTIQSELPRDYIDGLLDPYRLPTL